MKKFIARCAATMVASGLAATALADWSSGGGLLSRDRMNPWWLSNTNTVEFCIQIDDANFGISQDVAKKRIFEAINYWKESFDNRDLLTGNKETIQASLLGIGSQQFRLVEACHKAKLRIQLGYLNELQKKAIGEPRDFVGVTIREDYNIETMVGKGFIYISPESGPLKMTGANILGQPWKLHNGALLRLVMIHELGHVFGIQHGDALWPNGPELMVSNKLGPVYANMPITKGSHFTFSTKYTCRGDGLSEEVAAVFDIADRNDCLFFEYNKMAETIQVSKFTPPASVTNEYEITSSKGLAKTLIGSIKVPDKSISHFYSAHIWLIFPKGRIVFPGYEDDTMYAAGGISSRHFLSTYVARNGHTSRELEIRVTSKGFSFGGLEITTTNDDGELSVLDL